MEDSNSYIQEYVFPLQLREMGYRVFPANLENDETVFFHATPEKNKNEIIANGFRFDPNGLQSMSFGTNSTVALNYAIAKRETQPGDWCILVVRYEEIAEAKRFDFGGDELHDYTLTTQPIILGYSKIPASYRHI